MELCQVIDLGVRKPVARPAKTPVAGTTERPVARKSTPRVRAAATWEGTTQVTFGIRAGVFWF